ncbi:MAG: tetratricopeptide repeat protein [Bacteroidota bacterium]
MNFTIQHQNNGKSQSYYIIFLFAVALYINTAGHYYALDDTTVLTQSKHGLTNIPALLTNDLFSPIYGQSLDIGVRWRPFLIFTSALEYEIFGENPFIGHVINIILYGLTGIVLLLLLSQMIPKAPLVAFITTMIFIAHPIHTEVVANIKSRDEIFSFLFLMLTLFFLHRFSNADNTHKRKQFMYSCLFYILSLLSKENGITFLAVIPLFLFCFTNKNLKQCLLLTLPYLTIVVLYLSLRASLFYGFIIGDRNMDILENQFYGIPFLQKIANILYVMGKYFLLLFFPHPLACDYSYNQIPLIGWTDIKALVPALILLVLFFFAIKTIWDNKKKSSDIIIQYSPLNIKLILSFCILFYFITISIVSNLLFNIGTPMAERFLFMPSLGFCLAITIIILHILQIKSWHELKFSSSLYIPLGLLLVVFSFKTIDRNSDWKDEFTLFSRDAQVVPNSSKIHYYYGGTLLDQYSRLQNDNPQKITGLRHALAEEKNAVAIYPKFYIAFYTIGLIYEQLQMVDSSIYYFQKVIEMEPRYYNAYGKLGFLYGKIKEDIDKSIFYFQKGLEGKPNNSLWGLQLGVVYGMKGMYKESIKIFQHVKEMDPQQINECNLNIGTAYLFSKNYSEALKYFHLLLRISPQDGIILKKIGETYQAMGDTVKAREYFEKIPK